VMAFGICLLVKNIATGQIATGIGGPSG